MAQVQIVLLLIVQEYNSQFRTSRKVGEVLCGIINPLHIFCILR